MSKKRNGWKKENNSMKEGGRRCKRNLVKKDKFRKRSTRREKRRFERKENKCKK